ncbi:MAG: hypothetical protein AAGE84_28360 [Cyanobacteria bacterium P01_G01_bin.39]
MNNIWYRFTLFGFMLLLIFAPFAGFAPLLLIILITGIYWFLSPIAKIIIAGNTEAETNNSVTSSTSTENEQCQRYTKY